MVDIPLSRRTIEAMKVLLDFPKFEEKEDYSIIVAYDDKLMEVTRLVNKNAAACEAMSQEIDRLRAQLARKKGKANG